MITQEAIHLYTKYRGDVDFFARTASAKEKVIITEIQWAEIDRMLQDLLIVSRGFASDGFNRTLQQRLDLLCDSPETAEILKAMTKAL